MQSGAVPIQRILAEAFTIPTDAPESDGTIAWDRTTLVYVEIEAGGKTGCGYTYCHSACAALIKSVLAPELMGRDSLSVRANWDAMAAIVRNIGRPGLASCAISALDIALWDVKARFLGCALSQLMPAARDSVPVYGSGGFTSYGQERLAEQLGGWAASGCAWVKMKVGRDPDADADRVRRARQAIGNAGLMVDANGAYSRKQALAMAQAFAQSQVCWFEEPVSSDDREGLRLVRDRAPAGMEVAAGEYGYTPDYFRVMLGARAVDALQADATRCGGYTGFLDAAAMASAFHIPFSSHCAPAIHLPAACAAPGLRHMEWFHDHVRIEQMLFEGAPCLEQGRIGPAPDRPGHGLTLRRADAEKYRT